MHLFGSNYLEKFFTVDGNLLENSWSTSDKLQLLREIESFIQIMEEESEFEFDNDVDVMEGLLEGFVSNLLVAPSDYQR